MIRFISYRLDVFFASGKSQHHNFAENGKTTKGSFYHFEVQYSFQYDSYLECMGKG